LTVIIKELRFIFCGKTYWFCRIR